MIEFFQQGGLIMVLLNLMGLAMLMIVGERIFSLFIKKDHSEPNLDRRILSLKFLGLASVLLGIYGTVVGYYVAFSVPMEVIEKIEKEYGGIFPIRDVSRVCLSTTIWGLTLSLGALVAWYVFRAKAYRIEHMRVR